MLRRALPLLLLLSSAPASADWEDGRVPEGDNAFTLERHTLELSLLGRSGFGVTRSFEISTYLPLDLALFPNLGFEWRLYEGPTWAASFKLTLGAGAYPIVGGGIIPYPPVAAGFVGFVAAGFEEGELMVSARAARPLTLTLRGGGLAIEMGVLALGGGLAVYVPLVLPIAAGGVAPGLTGGAEADLALGANDALIVSGDVYYLDGASEGLAMATAGWTHAWSHFHLTLGAYTLIDLPAAHALSDSLPVAPYANVYWRF
jgi:hypothetical protein